MKSRITIDVEHHPGVPTVEDLTKILDTLLPTMYALRAHTITVERDLD